MKPKQYIKGFIEWYKLKLKVTPDVLIPRPETELLVDEVLKHVKEKNSDSLLILDIGTGAGNIAIALAKNLSFHTNIQIIATDVSEKALVVAKQNAKLHAVSDKINFITSDLLDSIKNILQANLNSRLIIVTNLPYIPSDRIAYLDSSVKDFEPHVALDGGEDGFQLYEKLFQQIKDQGLKIDFLIGEIDYTHGELAAIIANGFFPDLYVEVKKDLAHMQRLLVIKQK